MFQLLSSSLSLNTSCAPVSTPNRNKPICCRYKPVSHLQNTQSCSLLWGKPGTRACGCQAGSGVGRCPGWDLTARRVPTAQPVLYWCARNMSFWSSISFNLAVLMNLLVAFFYPFRGVRGGIVAAVSGGLGRLHWDPGRMRTNVGCPLPTSDKLRLKPLVLNLT